LGAALVEHEGLEVDALRVKGVLSKLAALRSDEGGWTLIQLVVSMPLMVMLLGAALVSYNNGLTSQNRTGNRSEAVTQQQIGLERMSRDLRQAVGFTLQTSERVDFQLPVRQNGTIAYEPVRYDCSSGSCLRYSGPIGGSVGTAGNPVIIGVNNVDIFTPQPNDFNPYYLLIKVVVNVKASSVPVTLTDGVDLRNQTPLI
jgi:type II secretory pathway pseudopilin PulG